MASRCRFHARIKVAGRDLFLGRWPSKAAAESAKQLAKSGQATPAELQHEARAIEKRNASSRYHGVRWEPRTKSWLARTVKNRRAYQIGGIKDERAAAELHDRLALYVHGARARRNFVDAPTKPASLQALQTEMRAKRATSAYRGVSKDDNRTMLRWVASLVVRRRVLFLGRFKTERRAAVAHDRAVLYYEPKAAAARLNFPRLRSKLEPTSATALRGESRREFKAATYSEYRGVSRNKFSWVASIYVDGRTRYLGSFDSEEEAARAWDNAARKLRGNRAKVNFP